MPRTNRRAFLQQASSLATLAATHPLRTMAAGFRPAPPGIIDAHIHLYDPSRPGGVPWPEPSDTILYRPALPARYRSIAEPLGVTGAIAIECSPLAADNSWLLEVAASDSIIVGVIGDLDPGLDTFPAALETLTANPLFRGIRYGNLWNRDLGSALTNPTFVVNLKRLADAGLVLETANPNPALIADLVTLTDRVPSLRLIIDHLPQATPPASQSERALYEAHLETLSRRPQVYVKGSEVFRRVDGKVIHDPAFYKDWLDQIWQWFGEDRLFYGSDWPNSDHLATYAETLELIHHYVTGKGPVAMHKFFATNSLAIYQWKPRTDAQRRIAATQLPAATTKADRRPPAS